MPGFKGADRSRRGPSGGRGPGRRECLDWKDQRVHLVTDGPGKVPRPAWTKRSSWRSWSSRTPGHRTSWIQRSQGAQGERDAGPPARRTCWPCWTLKDHLDPLELEDKEEKKVLVNRSSWVLRKTGDKGPQDLQEQWVHLDLLVLPDHLVKPDLLDLQDSWSVELLVLLE